MPIIKVTVRVRPGASRTRVGGSYGDAGEILTVAVSAPPVNGAANEAVVSAVASAFGLRPRHVIVVSGHQGRTKVLELQVPQEDEARERLGELLAR